MSRKRFTVEQESQWLEKGVWNWKMRLAKADDARLDEVKSVTYGLHPAFPNPNRVIHDSSGRFELEVNSDIAQNETWGRFDVRVTIVLKNEREYHSVPLELKRPDGVMVPELLPLPATADFELSKTWYGYLKRKGAYGYARQVLEHALEQLRDPAASNQDPGAVLKNLIWVHQQRAFSTYKDSGLPGDTRLRDALKILENECKLDLKTCKDPETLGLGGAVYKRLWDASRVRSHLELSLAYYRRGYELMLERPRDADHDCGAFTGINVAHVCELLAMEIPDEVARDARELRLAEADRVRRKLATDLLTHPQPTQWWIAASMLDVFFCLACSDSSYEESLSSQAKAVEAIDASPWEVESTGSQLLRSARLQKHLARGRPDDIDVLLAKTMTTAFRKAVLVQDRGGIDGKLGLALSGGGFRASLFHIGVLARMAELDQLRHVEVISCVSGGSIVGAHYYLLLRKLLEETQDRKITRDHYIQLVKDLLDQFLAGVQKNIRMRVAAGLWTNLRMIFQPSHYSRTQRLGELYEKHLYAQVDDKAGKELWLNEAFIVPIGENGRREDVFSPKLENWRRGAKVPMLVLNATTLNTGRNWQFTASYMGEPQSYGTTADATERLDAVYYNEAPKKWQRYRLGQAVAASSCVPSLFTPIVLPDLFNGRTVRLVDGGVHDNQGTRALLDQDCEYAVVSDASGQMDSLTNPPHGELGVALRTNSVLQARVRIAQHQELQARLRTGLLRQCDFLHLRKDLERAVQSATARRGTVKGTETPMPPGDTTPYGVERRIQAALAGLRTDLDSFTDREALSLMYSGYQMAVKYLAPGGKKMESHEKWRFLDVAAACAGGTQKPLHVESLLRHLQAGSKLAFKVWHLHPVLNAVRILLLATLGIGAFAGLIYLWRNQVKIPLDHWRIDADEIARGIVVLIIPILAAILYPSAKAWIARLKPALNPGSIITRMVTGVVMALFGWWLCGLHLLTFDWLFKRMGRVKPVTRT